jgi:hypothetical protein
MAVHRVELSTCTGRDARPAGIKKALHFCKAYVNPFE